MRNRFALAAIVVAALVPGSARIGAITYGFIDTNNTYSVGARVPVSICAARRILTESVPSNTPVSSAALLRGVSSRGASPVAGVSLRIRFSSEARSRAVWQRSFGFFARHLCTTCSKVAGASGWNVDIGGGFDVRIAAVALARLLAANARRPVSISYRTATNRKDIRAGVDLATFKNGTFVNGQKVSGGVRLSDRDKIRVGSVRLTFRALLPPPSTETTC